MDKKAKGKSDYDSPWKEVLELYFEQFMVFFFPKAHSSIDWSRGYQFLDKELQTIRLENEQGKRIVDKLVKIFLKNGYEQWILIHIEIQSQYDYDFDTRMFIYFYRMDII